MVHSLANAWQNLGFCLVVIHKQKGAKGWFCNVQTNTLRISFGTILHTVWVATLVKHATDVRLLDFRTSNPLREIDPRMTYNVQKVEKDQI